MNNRVKKIFLKRKTLLNQNDRGLKIYPQSFEKIGLFCDNQNMPSDNFISKLKSVFGNQTEILIFVFSEIKKDDNLIYLNYKNIDVFGKFKALSIKKELGVLNVIIDMTVQYSILKHYVLSVARQAYKIALGKYGDNIYHLSFDLKTFDQDLLAHEIKKYHSILNHAKS